MPTPPDAPTPEPPAAPEGGAGAGVGVPLTGEWPAVERRRSTADRRQAPRIGGADRRTNSWDLARLTHAALPPTAAPIADAPVRERGARPAAMTAEELGGLLEQVTDPLFVVDREWRLRFVNAAAATLWRLSPAAATGRSLWSVLPQTTAATAHEQLVRAMHEQRTAHLDHFATRQSGWVEVSAYPTGDGLLVLQRDVALVRAGEPAARALAAERRAREEAERLAGELRAARAAADQARHAADQARATAEVAARAKSDFLATMSHELRTPINAVTGYAQLLELGVAGPVTDAQRGYLERVLASSHHLLGLVDDVLDLARLEAGRLAVELVSATVRPVTNGALALVASQAAARGVRLAEPAADADARFVGDEHRVRQILVNLLTNAIKFTSAGGEVRVDIAADVERGPRPAADPWVTIRVADTGVGIPHALHEAIFEPFVQGDGSRTRTVGGTGLGLAVSRGLARLMGGDLTVASEPGAGAEFTLWLPSRLPEPEEPPARPRGPRTRSAGREGRGHGGSRPAVAITATHGLASVGTRLRQNLESLLEGYTARLRADAAIPQAEALPRAQLEDHALSFVADLAQTLVVLEHAGSVDAELLRDGSAIQEEIAFRHGEQRHRLGWSESHLRRDYAVLRDEVETVVRQTAASGGSDVALALSVLHRLMTRALEVSLRGWRHSASR
ncbi:PAS domain-containing sensor histidine kinase [Roseisolibacter sp. H3M3-2]|uniref:PAS domain-containing sensor histidine kinase n=1 Tax=Roseisolibacter sp. H3M3-2 TaxID=3031323 RepID=UPI0023DC0956|nr:PAS domain-containing sensor histidine kinase [Roseisolibacter sp. H3M3-2]MDF1503216.1 ATP-binding protein [Roseisolibacter sp. H3M3-2]